MGFFTQSVEYTDRWGDKGTKTVLRKGRAAAVIGVILLIVFVFLFCTTRIPTGHTGVVTTFGQVENYTLDAGIHLKAPWQKVVRMDNRVQRETIELSCFSSDIQEVTMSYTVYYQISQSNAMTIYSTLGKRYNEQIIAPSVNEAVKIVTAKYTAEELVANRSELAFGITQELTTKLGAYNIVFVDGAIENLDFTDAFTNAVEAKQVAQQNKLKAETEAEQKKIEAAAEAEVKLLTAQAEAEANRLLTESITPEILDRLYYDVWDGKLPTVYGAEGMMINMP